MITYKEMADAQTLTSVSTSYYIAPANTQGAIHAITANNPTGSPVPVNIYRVPAGGTVSAAYLIASRIVPGGGTVSFPDAVNHKLAPGSNIYADGVGCTLNISGVEYVPGT